MARTNAQFQFTSGEHDVYTTMARPEVSHRFCGRPRMNQLARAVENHLREERTERAATEQRIADLFRREAERRHPQPLLRETYFSYLAGGYVTNYVMPARPTPPKPKKMQPAPRPVPAFHVTLNGVTLDTDEVRELDNLVECLESGPQPFDDFDDDVLEDRTDERVAHLIDGYDNWKANRHGKRNGARRSLTPPTYRGEIRIAIRVDGRLFVT